MLNNNFIIKIIVINVFDYDKFFNKLNKKFIIRKEFINYFSKFFKNKIDCFDYKKTNKFLLHQKNDHKIKLIFEATFSIKKIYEMFKNQIVIIKTYVNKMLKKKYSI